MHFSTYSLYYVYDANTCKFLGFHVKKYATKCIFKNFSKMVTIFKPKFNFLGILKANVVKHPKRVMTI